MAKDETITVEGEVIESLPNAMFKVKLENDHVVKINDIYCMILRLIALILLTYRIFPLCKFRNYF